MAIVIPPSKVLVTGANGFIAAWIVRYLLEAGYAVRGTVRSADKGEFLKKKFASFGNKLEFVVIPDMMTSGAFDDSVVGVDAVLHTAAPVVMTGTYDTVVKPAVGLTENVLDSILNHGSAVQRVVITSSVVTLLQPHEPDYIYTDADWNEYSIKAVTENPDKAPGFLFYIAAKTLAERAAWKFYEEHKSEIKWDMATLLPPYVFGPLINETNGKPYSYLYNQLQQEKPASSVGESAGSWIDVRDVATAHVRSLQEQEIAEQRLIITPGGFTWQDVYDAIASVEPKIEGLAKGVPGVKRGIIADPDSSKANRILGLQYHSLVDSVRDTVNSVREHSA